MAWPLKSRPCFCLTVRIRSKSLSLAPTQGEGIRLHLRKIKVSKNVPTYFKDFIYSFLESREGRESERESNINA